MPSRDMQLVASVYAAFARGDIAAVMAPMRADVEWVTPPTLPWSRGTYRGPAELAEYFDSFAAALENPQVRPHELHPLSDGRVIALGVERARARGTGATFETRFVHLWTLEDGVVTAMRGLVDTAAVQAAFAPAPLISADRSSAADAVADVRRVR
jgi:ketosteroid isomerase-like protein